MNDPRGLLEIYIKFREKIKNAKKSSISKVIQCIIVTKEDMANWKKFFNYSKQLISNNSLLNEWEEKIKLKKNVKRPVFKILKDYKEIKAHLNKNKGISFLSNDFLNFYNNTNKKYDQINCSFGNGKIIMHLYFESKRTNCLICKTKTQYIIYENVDNYYKLISEIIQKQNITKKNNFPNFFINKIILFEHQKNSNTEIYKESNINDYDSSLHNNNSSSSSHYFGNKINQTSITRNYRIDKDDCNVPNSIFEFFVLLFKFYEDIRKNITKKDFTSEFYYLINFDFLDNIKNTYNYNAISKELEKYKYINDNDFDYKYKDIIKSIKQKGIIKETLPIDDIDIIPTALTFFGSLHNVNFTIINEKIFSTIKQIQNDFNLTKNTKVTKYQFYFRPQLFYKGQKFIKIGRLDKDYIFEIQYFITLDLTKANPSMIISELMNSSSVKNFFTKKNIKIDSKDVHDLIDYNINNGKVINFLYKNQNNINNIGNEIPYSSTLKGNNVKIKNIVIKNTNQTKKYNNFSNSSTINSNASDDLPNVIALKSLDNFPIKKIDQINITPMIGLQNIGQTCYMNAALQCFSNTKALTSYFLNYNNLQYLKSNTITISGTNEPSLVIEYLRLVRHLWCDPPKSAYAPNEFKKAIGKMDSLFKDFEANDAKDFVNFMVMRLHDELNGVDNHLTKQNNLTPPPNILNPYDQIQVLQSYLYEFQINFNSFISNCFYGTTQGEFECQNCKMQIYQTGQNLPLVKYNYQTFFFLNFPLNEVSKYILSNQMLYMKYMNSGINPSSVVNLIDCFYYYQKDEILSCYCDRCFNNNAQVLTRTKLYVAPIYLILLFNRGKGIQYNIKITFPETLDTNGLFVNPSGLYQLYGVVKHYGDSSASGHFTAYCRSPIDRQWYYYNDAMVTPVNEQDKYQIQENGLTYMLFYNQINK